MNHKPNKLFKGSRTRGGAILVVVVVVMLLIGLTGLSLLGIGKHMRLRAIETVQDTTARCAADAGVAHAQYLVLKTYGTLPWPGIAPVTDATLDGTNATYSYTVTGTPSATITVEGVGKCGPVERKVYCKMVEKADLIGIGAIGKITFIQNFVVRGRGAVLRTNATGKKVISVSTGDVAADLIVGPGADVATAIDLGAQVKHNGTKSAAEEPVVYPPVLWPSPVPGTVLPANQAQISASGTYMMPGTNTNLRIKKPANVVLYMDGPIDVGNQDGVLVENGATLTLYVNGNITGNNGVRFYSDDNSDPVRVATSILVYGTDKCTTVNLKNGADSYALLYVPSAAVEFKNNAELYGAMIVNSIEAKNNAVFTYIPELRDILNVPAKKLFVDRWWE